MDRIAELAEYVLGFYGDGEDSLKYFESWGYQPMTHEEIMAVLPHVEQVYPNEITNGTPVNVDTFVREVIRDFVLTGRGVEKPMEHFVSVEERDIFNANKDEWRSELEDARSAKSMSYSEMMKLWYKIIEPSKVKPQWFGFLRK